MKSLGIPSVILFGLPETKDELATGAWADDGIVQQASRAIKKEVPGLLVMGDVCLCEYMSHGHCGIVQKTGSGRSVGAASVAQMSGVDEYEILNDESLEIIAKTAVSQARAGMDIIAPSDMMDGRVAAIRDALDDAGFENIPILSYAAKFASGFYGPFREAADSAPAVRRSPLLPDGRRQPARSHARNRTRPRRRRRHDHGEAGHALSRRDRRGPPPLTMFRSPPTRSAASTP